MESILDAQRSLPSWIFRRLYLNLPGQPDDAAFDAESVENAVVANRRVLPPEPGLTAFAFCELSGRWRRRFSIGHCLCDQREVYPRMLDRPRPTDQRHVLAGRDG